jgi:type II secretory pathway pseudopilin PulG
LNLTVNKNLYEHFQQQQNEQQQQEQQQYQQQQQCTTLSNQHKHGDFCSCLSWHGLHVGFSPGYTPPATVKLKETDPNLIQRSSHILEFNNNNPDNSNQFLASACVMEDEALFGDIPTLCSNNVTFGTSAQILDDEMVLQEFEWITQLPFSPPLSPSDSIVPVDDFVLFPP